VATPQGGPVFDVVDMMAVDDEGLITECVVYER
jgi:hypothetical protein